MPEIPYEKIKPDPPEPGDGPSNIPYAELQVTSNFTFLQSGSHPEELVAQAAALGYRGIAITDHNSLAGAVRAHIAAREARIPFRVGCRLELRQGEGNPSPPSEVLPLTMGQGEGNPSPPSEVLPSTRGDILPRRGRCPEGAEGFHEAAFECRAPILVYPTDRDSYGRLCRLLSIGKLRADKGGCFITVEEFLQFHTGLIAIVVPPYLCADNRALANKEAASFYDFAKSLGEKLDDPSVLYMALTRSYTALNQTHLRVTQDIAESLRIKTVATNDAYYHAPERKQLLDVVTCIRNRCTIEQAGFKLQQNAERHLKSPAEMRRLFRDSPRALAATIEILDRTAGFSLDQLRYEYPREVTPANVMPLDYLQELTLQGAKERYPDGVPEKVEKLLVEEFKLIDELDYAKYFLTCYHIVKFARSKNILCQGRGAAANSAVCYCLGITAVDPARIDLLFARFVSKERNEPPDIDIDFEHERREEVMQYIYQQFTRERAGLVCAVITYRYRSAVRDTGKALGLSLETVDKLTKIIHRWTHCRIEPDELRSIGLSPDDPTVQLTISLSNELLGFPRHLTQHSGGFVVSERPLNETVPLLNTAMESRTMIEWDKDDIDALGMLKIDILALGMLTCIRKALETISASRRLAAPDSPPLELYSIPAEDPKVYRMIQKADTVGVFQIESRAQMSMLPRLKPNRFYDLVIEVAIVRPGPIQGNMVHPYLRRRSGLEKIEYPDARVEEVLGKTLGVPIFQEQAMRLAIVLAKFTPGEAEQLRRAMAAWKRDKGKLASFHARIIHGMKESGYTEEFAECCFSQMKGFSEYGFPESHAASFALLVYASSWIKCHYPAHFTAALINSQPMGFYAPSQLISDAHQHGVEILPIDIHSSRWDCMIEGPKESLRLGMRLVKGLPEEQANIIVKLMDECREVGSIQELWNYARLSGFPLRRKSLEVLARADAFRSLRLAGREALWEIQSLPAEAAPLDPYENLSARTKVALPERSRQEDMFADYGATGLSLRGHPIQFIREGLVRRGVLTASFVKNKDNCKVGSYIAVAGIAIIRQRPGTAKGVVFITLEDETGITNLILRPQIFEQFRTAVLMSSTLMGWGKLERIDEIVYVSAERIESLDDLAMRAQRGGIPSDSYSY